jgi:RND family efflux transporter MFP subunit
LTIALLALIAAAGWAALKAMRAQSVKTNPNEARAAGKPIPVSTVRVDSATLESLAAAECIAQESSRVELATEFDFRVARVETAIGMAVKKDELLLAFEDKTIKAELSNALQGQAAARSLVADLEPFLNDMRRLEEKKLVSVIDMLRAVEDVGQAKLDLIRTSKDVIRARHQVAKTEVRAPLDGVVTALNVQVGSTPQPFTELLVISQINPIQLECAFSETDIDAITDHDRIDASFTAYPGRVFAAEFFQILPVLKEHTHTLTALLRVANEANSFLPGMHAVARIGQRLEGLRIPAISLIKPQQNKANVFVVDAANTAHLRTIEIGPYAQGYVQVTNGLAAGEQVVVAGQLYLLDGDKVRQESDESTIKHELFPIRDR